jgi:hypothetical protein
VLVGLGVSFAGLYVAGHEVSIARFEMRRGGVDTGMPHTITLTIWLSQSVADILFSTFVLPWYLEQLGCE